MFGPIATAGTQLGRISDVLNILLLSVENSGGISTADADAPRKIQAFKDMYAQINKEKEGRAQERIIETLQQLKTDDNKAFQSVASQLKQWLNAQTDIIESVSGAN